jgi:hypothetical protein
LGTAAFTESDSAATSRVAPNDQDSSVHLARMPPQPLHHIDDEVLAHISPAHSGNINFFGVIEVDIEDELARLG